MSIANENRARLKCQLEGLEQGDQHTALFVVVISADPISPWPNLFSGYVGARLLIKVRGAPLSLARGSTFSIDVRLTAPGIGWGDAATVSTGTQSRF